MKLVDRCFPRKQESSLAVEEEMHDFQTPVLIICNIKMQAIYWTAEKKALITYVRIFVHQRPRIKALSGEGILSRKTLVSYIVQQLTEPVQYQPASH